MIQHLETQINPIPANEVERLKVLEELDLDYLDLRKSMDDLSRLAAKIAGTKISLINLIDHFTQWTVASFGMEIDQMPREESICQYTIIGERNQEFEIKNLVEDDRFKDRNYVQDEPNLRYYLGIPLKVNEDLSIGALCVLDTEYKELSAEKREILYIIADEIVTRIKAQKLINDLELEVQNTNQTKNRLAHDIRGPLGGIIGLTNLVKLQGEDASKLEMLEYFQLIQKTGKTLLELTDEILSKEISLKESAGQLKQGEINLLLLGQKLEDMFNPQAKVKEVSFNVFYNKKNSATPFSRQKILQIIGNLVSNSIKFTPKGGSVNVKLELDVLDLEKILRIEVSDTGEGMPQSKIDEIILGEAESTLGTNGEKGFGFGLKMVVLTIQTLKGKISIHSKEGEGTQTKIILPMQDG